MTIYALGIVLQTETQLTDEIAGLDRELNAWVARLHEWLRSLAGGPTGYDWNPGLVHWPSDIGFELQNKAYLEGEFHEPEVASVWQWEHASSHAGSNDLPPASHALLSAAVSEAVDGNYRSAALDAATAAELALTEAVSSNVRDRGGDAKVCEALLKNKTLGALIQLARELSLALPSGIDKDLTKLRNQVMHRGYVPTSDDAKKAIRITSAIVTGLDPLPDHCNELIYLERQAEESDL